MNKLKDPALRGFWLKLIACFLIILVFQIVFNYYAIRFISLRTVDASIRMFGDRLEQGLRVEKGKWDISRYVSDPQTPSPRKTVGNTGALYIITDNGFVLERNAPINGFLDSSDYRNLLRFTQPQTIDTITGESWRVLSETVEQNGKSHAVVFVAFYDPHRELYSTIDQELVNNIKEIKSKIKITSDAVDVSELDIRNIQHDVTFEIVTPFNKVLLSDGRTPSFIDTSYFAEELTLLAKPRIITDSVTKDRYYVVSRPLRDKNGDISGILVQGRTIEPLHRVLSAYVRYASISTILILFPLAILVLFVFARELEIIRATIQRSLPVQPKRIRFDKKRGVVVINDQTVQIPYASNQYYLCEAVFANPKKRWEQDELLERFGETIEDAGRKVYDAVLAINKKVNIKLIEYKDKTCRLNPSLLPHVTHT